MKPPGDASAFSIAHESFGALKPTEREQPVIWDFLSLRLFINTIYIYLSQCFSIKDTFLHRSHSQSSTSRLCTRAAGRLRNKLPGNHSIVYLVQSPLRYRTFRLNQLRRRPLLHPHRSSTTFLPRLLWGPPELLCPCLMLTLLITWSRATGVQELFVDRRLRRRRRCRYLRSRALDHESTITWQVYSWHFISIFCSHKNLHYYSQYIYIHKVYCFSGTGFNPITGEPMAEGPAYAQPVSSLKLASNRVLI